MKETTDDPVVFELKRITKLLALSIVKTEPTSKEQIKLLHQLEFQNKEIADLLKIPESTVGTILFRDRQAKTKKTKVVNN